jgi:Domain of unknown function (DUF4386)
MTHTTNARIAGFTFLFYIVAGITSLVLFSQATGGGGITAKLASIAQHVLQARMTIVLGLVQAVCAIVLAVTLYAITRDQDSDLAMLAMIFRVGEGLLNAFSSRDTLELLWLGTSVGPKAPDAVTLQALGTYLLGGPDWNMSAILFAMGSTLFSYLLLRGRTIPVHWRGSALLPRSFSWWVFLCNSLDSSRARLRHTCGYPWPRSKCPSASGC